MNFASISLVGIEVARATCMRSARNTGHDTRRRCHLLARSAQHVRRKVYSVLVRVCETFFFLQKKSTPHLITPNIVLLGKWMLKVSSAPVSATASKYVELYANEIHTCKVEAKPRWTPRRPPPCQIGNPALGNILVTVRPPLELV